MGGKTSQSTQSVSIPPEVLARYNAVNTRAEQVAQRPFQQYTEQFVAPLTGTQQAGIQGTTSGANLAQPFFGAGTGLTMAGAQDVGPLTQGQIAYYENPYIESVARPTYQALRQQQQEEMMGQTANAIRAGAFGGDRAGLVAANLARQQQLGTAQALAPIYAQGYGQAVQTAAGQQGVVAADLARRMQAGQQIAGLGAGAQQAALQGAQAQLAAGTAEQQTQQADLTARYNQFLQEQGYPFQVAQFLANIAMGTGALSGSTTTTTQPSSFFSDRRLKANVEEIGKLKDGQKLYRYTMADGRTHIGLMADEVEKHHPDAVGVAGGYKTVDYRAATDDAARHKKAYGGGLMPSSEGGAVTPSMAGEGYARGGQIAELKRLLTMHREMVPYGHSGLYGNPDPRKGPYSTTMREINVPSRPLAPTTITIRPLNYAADIPAGVPQYAAGGVVGYADGGLPYSEASEEYVPEDISKPMTSQSLKPAGGATGPVQDPTVRDLMQMGRMAASIHAGGGFASGGLVPHMADGGGMDFDRIIAMQQGMYGQMGRPAGLNIPAMQPRDPVKSMELMKPSAPPAPMKSGMQEAMDAYRQAEQAGNMASSAYGAGKTALFGREEVKPTYNQAGQQMTVGSAASRGAIGMGGQYKPEEGYFYKPEEFLPEWMRSRPTPAPTQPMPPVQPLASGGVAGRLHYQDAGAVSSSDMTPNQRAAAIDENIRRDAADRAVARAASEAAARSQPQFPARTDLQKSDDRHSLSISPIPPVPQALASPPAPRRAGVAPPIDNNENVIGRVNFLDRLSSRDEEITAAVNRAAADAAPVSRPTIGVAPQSPIPTRDVAPVNTPGMGAYAGRVSEDESGNGRVMQNPRSSASGFYGILQSSWNDIRRANPDLNLPATVNESTPDQQRQAFDRYTAANANTLERIGRTADYPTLRLAHYFGAGGANALLGIDPNTRFDNLSDEFVRTRLGTRGQGPQSTEQLLSTNPNLRGRTVGQVIEDYRNRYGNVGVAQEPKAASASLKEAPNAPDGVVGPAPIDDVSYNRVAGRGETLRQISQQDMDSVRSRVLGEQTPVSGDEGGRGLLGAVANEKFLVPLLAGLSGMASSPSRYLGSAILQGLGAGALQYEKMANALPQRQKTQAEAFQQESAMRERLLNEFESYKALTGDSDLTLEEFSKRLGIPYRMSFPASSTVPPAQRAESTLGNRSQMNLSLQGYRTEVVSYPSGETVPASNDPGYLRQFIARNSSITAPAVVGAVADAKSRLAQIEASGRTTDINGNEIFIPGRQATLNTESARQSTAAEANKFVEAGNQFIAEYPNLEKRLTDLDKIYRNYVGGGFAAAPRAELAALARAVGVTLPASFADDDTQYQTALKLVTQQMIDSVARMSGNAPRAELAAAANANAVPSMSPEARRNIIVNLKSALNYQNKLYDGYNADAREPVRNYLQRVNSERLFDKTVEDAEKTTPQYGQAQSVRPTPSQANQLLRMRGAQ